MTGPEHYREAEAYLKTAVDTEDVALASYAVAQAQAHATLAAAAATMSVTFAVIGAAGLPPTGAVSAWTDVLQPNR
jgi:hypothetical protein